MKNNKYKLHWLDGTTSVIEGSDVADAFMRAGFSGGAMRALDCWERVKE